MKEVEVEPAGLSERSLLATSHPPTMEEPVPRCSSEITPTDKIQEELDREMKQLDHIFALHFDEMVRRRCSNRKFRSGPPITLYQAVKHTTHQRIVPLHYMETMHSETPEIRDVSLVHSL